MRSAGAHALADALSQKGFKAKAVTDLQAAVGQADIISCATLSTEPLIHGNWLRPGTHLDLIGSFTPEMCEADTACFDKTAVYVDTPEALMKSGDLLNVLSAGVMQANDIRGTLHGLVCGEVGGRRGALEITVFKAVGSALENLAAAAYVYDHYRNK